MLIRYQKLSFSCSFLYISLISNAHQAHIASPKLQFSCSCLYISLISNAHQIPKTFIFMHFLFPLSSGTALGRNFRPAVWLRKIGFPLMRRLEKIIFWGAGGPPPVIRCPTTQLAPSVNVPRIRRRLVARFGSKEHRSTSDDECIVRHSSGDAIKKFMVTSESQMWHELGFVPQVTRVHF